VDQEIDLQVVEEEEWDEEVELEQVREEVVYVLSVGRIWFVKG